MGQNGKLKIPAQRVPSDDCLIYVGRVIGDGCIIEQGTPYAVHKGEWVEVLRLGAIRQYLALMHLTQGAALASKELDEVNQVEVATGMENALNDLCHELAQRVIRWNWTGMDGKPLPQPYQNDQAIKDLTEDELIWLAQVAQGEGPGQRKNASGALRRTSSTKAHAHPRA